MAVTSDETLLDITWSDTDAGWQATLRTITADSVITRPLSPGTELAFEVSDERRCTGYVPESGTRQPCPNHATLETGQQCATCRSRDVHRDYIEGTSGQARSGPHSVYLAQCGETVKVGVTRTTRVLERWIEQGASYAVEVESDVSAQAALDREAELSTAGLPERIRKSQKIPPASSCRLETVMDEYGLSGTIIDLTDRTVYPRVDCATVTRTGRAVGTVRAVQGQIMNLDDLCLAVTPGRCIHPPSQRGLNDWTAHDED